MKINYPIAMIIGSIVLFMIILIICFCIAFPEKTEKHNFMDINQLKQTDINTGAFFIQPDLNRTSPVFRMHIKIPTADDFAINTCKELNKIGFYCIDLNSLIQSFDTLSNEDWNKKSCDTNFCFLQTKPKLCIWPDFNTRNCYEITKVD